LRLEVNAPDRTVALVYGNPVDAEAIVPLGMDGEIWHLRIGVGSATVVSRDHEPPRYPYMRLTKDLKGVPGYLSPKWEQWFDPRKPVPPLQRQ